MTGAMALHIGWRNLWRNRRRTWLTAGGVAFAVFLVVATMCIQLGSYRTMEETATSLLTGHVQIQSAHYVTEERLEDALPAAGRLTGLVRQVQGVAAATPRVEAFVLASAGERSFGAQLLGIEPHSHVRVVSFHERIVRGRDLRSAGEGVLGEALARNLGVDVGDEAVLLGSAREGGVAAMVVRVVGVFRTGMAELDRGLLLAHIDDVRTAFELEDRVHTLVVRAPDLDAVDAAVEALVTALPPRWPAAGGGEPVRVRSWQEVLPELRQAIEIDRISGVLMYWIIMVLVAFSVVNTFIMTVYERTREFGVLLAIGMRPRRIVVMLQWEAVFIWALGTGAGLLLATALVAWLGRVGIYLGEEMEQLAREMYMPTRLYPSFTREALLTAPLVMFVGTQLAAVLPSLRLLRLEPATALRVPA